MHGYELKFVTDRKRREGGVGFRTEFRNLLDTQAAGGQFRTHSIKELLTQFVSKMFGDDNCEVVCATVFFRRKVCQIY